MKQPPSQTLSLKLNPRPLRLAYMVRDRARLLDGVRLLTHIWGGKTDILLPLPTTDEERKQLLEALTGFDPDFIIFDPDEVSPDLSDLLAPLPCIKRQLRVGEMNEYVNGQNPLLLGSGQAADPYSVLQEQFPSGLQGSRIRVVEPNGRFDFVTRVMWGDPLDNVAAWFHRNFGAKLLRAPDNVGELVRTSLICNDRMTPIDISATAAFPSITYRGFEGIDDPLRGPLSQNEHSIFLFLDDGQSLSVSCAYWNARAASSGNKLLLPLDLFQEALPDVLRDVRASRRVDNWIVVAELEEAQAESLKTAIVTALRDREIGGDVAILRAGFKYSIAPFRAVSGRSTSITVGVGPESSIRFVAPSPKFSPSGSLFGFDADVTRPDGDKLSLPTTADIALLLSNSEERLRRFETNEAGLGALWLHRGLPVRSRRDGIAATTTSEEECVWYLPTPDRVIQRALGSRGVNLAANRHTRYAIGVANRLGGLDDAMAFTRAGGFALLKPLLSGRAAQAGLRSQQFQQLLQTESGLSQEAAGKAMTVHLPRLLETDLIRRGFALTCRHCDLTEWYAVSDLREFVECVGCGELFQLTGPWLAFSYSINELARRMVEEGGLAVLSTAAAFDAMGGGQSIQLGGNLTRESESEPFAEIDVLCVNRDAFAIAECKDRRDLTLAAALTQVAESLGRAIAIAPTLGAQIVVLGIATSLWNDELFRLVSQSATRAEESGLAVHLILNGQLHPSGDETPIEPGRVAFGNLLIPRETQAPLRVSGTLPTTFGGGRLVSVVAQDVIEAWEFNALARPQLGGDSG